MGSQFLRFANLATQVLAGSAGQVFYNTDTNKLNVYNGASWTAVGSGISSITVGIGLTTATNPIVDSGTINVDQAYDFTWTGSHTFNNVVNFAAAGQTFAATKLFIAGQTAGDLIYYNGSSWTRLGIGSTSQVLSVNSAGNAITWAASTGGGGGGAGWTGGSNSPAAANGGSGGGGSARYIVGGASSQDTGGTGTAGQGNNGGSGVYTGDAGQLKGGGGGGAGGAGANATGSAAGIGGAGSNSYSTWATTTSTGSSGYYAVGGSGNGAAAQTGGSSTTGTVNTGNGAGAGSYAGGSGIVIVRY
jgi:hypothetical protein